MADFAESRGSVTAEFAVVLPAILLVVAALISGVQVLTQQYALTVVTQQASRVSLFAGDTAARQLIIAEHPATQVRIEHAAGALCIHTRRAIDLFGMSLITIGARSCVAA